MILEHFYLGCLAQASYLIGSEGTAVVIDPQRDVDLYIDAARERGLQIQHIIETHLHADFVSGHRELAERTGARIYLGAGSGATFPHQSVRDGDEIAFGQCVLQFLQTPGHTVESVSILLIDREQGDAPCAVFTGDTLFIGDVGRPDLSETHTPQELAGLLYDSLWNKLLKLPDEVSVYPAHGAGSMCGRNISSDRSSTIGRERRLNYALQPMTRDQFIGMMTAELPPRPEYFGRDVELNRRGAAALADLPATPPLTPQEARSLQQSGAAILDTRVAGAFCSGHAPGSINIGLNGQFASWAGSVLGLDRDLILLTEDESVVEEARQRLARVGIERVSGFISAGISGWACAGLPLEQTAQIAVNELQPHIQEHNAWLVLDVRRRPEWEDGHIPGAIHIPLDNLPSVIESAGSGQPLEQSRTIAVHCKSGYRSSIACSLLQANGFRGVVNVLGGFDAWRAAGLPVAQAELDGNNVAAEAVEVDRASQ